MSRFSAVKYTLSSARLHSTLSTLIVYHRRHTSLRHTVAYAAECFRRTGDRHLRGVGREYGRADKSVVGHYGVKAHVVEIQYGYGRHRGRTLLQPAARQTHEQFARIAAYVEQLGGGMSESQRTHYSCGEIVGRKLMACAPAGLTVLRLRDAIHVGILLMPLFGHVKDQCALVGSDREITLRQTGGQYALLARCGVDGTQFAPSRSLGRIVISVGDRHPRHIGALAPAAHETLRTGEQRITLHRTVGTRLLIS